jgi:hypothetical protein
MILRISNFTNFNPTDQLHNEFERLRKQIKKKLEIGLSSDLLFKYRK